MLRSLAAAALLIAAGCASGGTGSTPAPAAPGATTTPAVASRGPAPTGSPARSAAPPGGPCRYAFPVRPAGAASYAEAHHDYPATDIFAPRGTDVVSPTDGVVDFVSRVDRWDPKADDPAARGGLAVAIVGDDGVRYYGSHLQDVSPGVEPGVRVAVGRLLGHVGSSGNAEGISPHLHFGVSHPTTPDDWRVRRGEVSPFRYLNAWKAGTYLTPVVPGARPPSCVRAS